MNRFLTRFLSSVLISLISLAGCDTDGQSLEPPPSDLLAQARQAADFATDITDKALFISAQGIPTNRSFQLAYEGLANHDIEEFQEAFVLSSRSAQQTSLGNARLKSSSEDSLSAEQAFVLEVIGHLAKTDDPGTLLALAEASMLEATDRFDGDILASTEENIAVAYFSAVFVLENRWKMAAMVARDSGDLGSLNTWEGWQINLTQQNGGSQNGGQPTWDNPPDPRAFADNAGTISHIADWVLSGMGLGGAAGAAAGGLPGFFTGAVVGGAIGGFASVFTNDNGMRDFRIALDGWCRDRDNWGHPQRAELCD